MDVAWRTQKTEAGAGFAIRNPGDAVTAYVGEPLVFYVRADGAERFTMEKPDGMDATLDAKSGKFQWTPGDMDERKSYTVTFSAGRGEETAEKSVELSVVREGKEYKTAVFTVEENRTLESWSGGVTDNGKANILTVQKGNNASTNGELGILGQLATQGSGNEAKLPILKFNLNGSYQEDGSPAEGNFSYDGSAMKIFGADLSLTYIGGSSKNDGQKLKVARISNWAETWAKWDKNVEDAEVFESASYNMTNTRTNATTDMNVRGNANYNIDGRKITTDITPFVKNIYEAGNGDGTLLLGVNETLSKAHFFVSKEGAAFYSAIASRGIENAAPSILLDYSRDKEQNLPAIKGPEQMILQTGYAATGSDSFHIVTGADCKAENVKLSGNTAGGRITWNKEEQRLEIPAGLTRGIYEMTLFIPQSAATEPDAISNQTPEDTDVKCTFALQVKDIAAAPVFTNPGAEIRACMGMTVSFTVKAENPGDTSDIVTVSVDEESMQGLTGAVFDPKTGVFHWTPGMLDYGKHEVRFVANGQSNLPAYHTVTISVGSMAPEEMQAVTEPIPVVADAHTQSWGAEKNNRYGARLGLRAQNTMDPYKNSQYGWMGELGAPSDVKMFFLKFDLDQIGTDTAYDRAELELTYLGIPESAAFNANERRDATVQVSVAPVSSEFEWNDNEQDSAPMTRTKWTEWVSQNEEARRVHFEDIRMSDVYKLKAPLIDYRTVSDNINRGISYVDGTKVRVDISRMLKEAMAAYKQDASKHTLTLLVGGIGSGQTFASREAIDPDIGFIQPGVKEKVAAPSILLQKYPKGAVLEGPSAMTLTEGYAATSSDSFVIEEADGVTVSCEADTEHKITWNETKRCLDVDAGLDIGTYSVIVAYNGLEKEFTLTVGKNYKKDLEDLLANLKTEQGGYTGASWAAYQYAIASIRTALRSDAVSEEAYLACKALFDAAEQNLSTVAGGLEKQIKEQMGRVLLTEEYYLKDAWDSYQSALNAANEWVKKDGLTELEAEGAFTALKAAVDNLLKEENLNPDHPKAELGKSITAALLKTEDESYTKESRESLRQAIEKAQAVIDDLSADQTAIDGAKASLDQALAALKPLKTALAERIAELTKDVVEESSYTPGSYKTYREMLERAQALLKRESFSETEMDQTLAALADACSKLTFVTYKTKEELKMLLEEAEALEASDYTEESYAGLAEPLARAKEAYEKDDASGREITAAYEALDAALRALKPVEGQTPPAPEYKTKAELKALIEEAEALEASDYTEESYADLTEALKEAKKAYDKADATGEEITGAYRALDEAIKALEGAGTITPPAPEYKTEEELKTLLLEAEGKAASEFTADSYRLLTEAIADVKEVLEREDATPEEITTAYRKLAAALAELVFAPSGDGQKPGAPDAPNNGGNGSTGGNAEIKPGDSIVDGNALEYQVQTVSGQTATMILTKGKDQKTVTIPTKMNVKGVECTVVGIGSKAYQNAKSLKKVVIPDTVTSIGSEAFSGCKKLTSVTIGAGVTTIEKKAFFQCKKLKTVKIKGTALKTVKASAFKGTKSNIKVSLPKKMKAAQKKKIKNLLLKKGKMSKKAKIK